MKSMQVARSGLVALGIAAAVCAKGHVPWTSANVGAYVPGTTTFWMLVGPRLLLLHALFIAAALVGLRLAPGRFTAAWAAALAHLADRAWTYRLFGQFGFGSPLTGTLWCAVTGYVAADVWLGRNRHRMEESPWLSIAIASGSQLAVAGISIARMLLDGVALPWVLPRAGSLASHTAHALGPPLFASVLGAVLAYAVLRSLAARNLLPAPPERPSSGRRDALIVGAALVYLARGPAMHGGDAVHPPTANLVDALTTALDLGLLCVAMHAWSRVVGVPTPVSLGVLCVGIVAATQLSNSAWQARGGVLSMPMSGAPTGVGQRRLEMFFAAWRKGDEHRASHAAQLAASGPRAARLALAALPKVAAVERRALMGLLVGCCAPPFPDEAIATVARSGESATRAALCQALALAGATTTGNARLPRSAVAVLVASTKDSDAGVRAAAAAAFGSAPWWSAPAVDALRGLLRDPDRAVRLAAAHSLATTAQLLKGHAWFDGAQLTLIEHLARDPDAPWAAEALAGLPVGPAAVPLVVARLVKVPVAAQERAHQALAALPRGMLAGCGQVALALEAAPPELVNALQKIRASGPSPTVAALKALLDDPDTAAKVVAIDALAALGPAAAPAVPALQRLATTVPELAHPLLRVAIAIGPAAAELVPALLPRARGEREMTVLAIEAAAATGTLPAFERLWRGRAYSYEYERSALLAEASRPGASPVLAALLVGMGFDFYDDMTVQAIQLHPDWFQPLYERGIASSDLRDHSARGLALITRPGGPELVDLLKSLPLRSYRTRAAAELIAARPTLTAGELGAVWAALNRSVFVEDAIRGLACVRVEPEEALLTALDDARAPVRAAAVAVLGLTGQDEPRVRAAIERLERDPDPHTAAEARRARADLDEK